MRVVAEVDTGFDVYTLTNTVLIKHRYFQDLPGLLPHLFPHVAGDVLSQHAFLLHERHFDYVEFTIELTSHEPLTIQDLKQIILQKGVHLKNAYGLSSSYAKHRITDITINGKPSPFLIGKTGDISFRLQWYVLKMDMVAAFKIQVGDHALQKCLIYPKHMFLLEYITGSYHAHEIAVVTIQERTCALFFCEQGWYQRVEEIGMGESLLKACYEEHNVVDYLYHSAESIEHNPLLKRLVGDALDFYTQQLCQWLHHFLEGRQRVIMIGNVVENTLFVDQLKARHHATTMGFLIPLHAIPTDIVGYHPSDLPVVAYYNGLQADSS